MNLATILDNLRGVNPCATTEDIRDEFGDYHNLLRWLAAFLACDASHAEADVVDACTIADRQTPAFHEWLVHWAARATIDHALQEQYAEVLDLARKYEGVEACEQRQAPVCKQDFLFVVRNPDKVRASLDSLCRFVLVLCGFANDSYEQVAAQLGSSPTAVERAYCIAVDKLRLAGEAVPHVADQAPVKLTTNTPRELEAV